MLARFECPRCQTVFPHEQGDDDAFVECPSCGALAMSIGEATNVDSNALARALSSSHEAPTDLRNTALGSTQDPSAESAEPSGPQRADPFAPAGAGVFAGLMGSPGEADPTGPPPLSDRPARVSVPHDGIDLGLDDALGDFSLPTSPGSASSPLKPAPAKTARPPPRGPAVEQPAGLPSLGDSLSDDAFGGLEAAFDIMAAKPTGNRRGKDGLSEDDRRFLRGEPTAQAPAKSGATRAPPQRPPARPAQRPPPRTAAQRPRERSRGIVLSLEARQAAFLPLRVASGPIKAQGPSEDPAPPSGEHTLPLLQLPRSAAKPVEATTIVPKTPRRVVHEKPSILGGLPALALGIAVVVGLFGGAAAGALTAPTSVKRNDARGRAELQLAEGNRFYNDGRFDDALGKYKGAINIDRTFALAHRAKGAALAKQQHWDEAATAYREYLGLESSAIDASDVKEALARRGILPERAHDQAASP